MARQVRLDYPNTFYHVLSRGNERRDIFWEQGDYERFTETIGNLVDRFDLEVHAYVLMSNHYHLLIRTRDANLSKAIQWLGLSYSAWFNRRHMRTGHLFQGRFKSFVVENERYFAAMCFYIHGNPLRAGTVKNLLDYPWSSYPSYAASRKIAPWLTTDLVLGRYGASRKRFIDAQLAYVGAKETILDKLKYGLFLGSEEFVNKAIKQQRKDRKKAQKVLRNRNIEKSQGLVMPNKASMPNRKCEYETVEQEGATRMDAATEQLKIFRSQLPTLLRRLPKIPDPMFCCMYKFGVTEKYLAVIQCSQKVDDGEGLLVIIDQEN